MGVDRGQGVEGSGTGYRGGIGSGDCVRNRRKLVRAQGRMAVLEGRGRR